MALLDARGCFRRQSPFASNFFPDNILRSHFFLDVAIFSTVFLSPPFGPVLVAKIVTLRSPYGEASLPPLMLWQAFDTVCVFPGPFWLSPSSIFLLVQLFFPLPSVSFSQTVTLVMTRRPPARFRGTGRGFFLFPRGLYIFFVLRMHPRCSPPQGVLSPSKTRSLLALVHFMSRSLFGNGDPFFFLPFALLNNVTLILACVSSPGPSLVLPGPASRTPPPLLSRVWVPAYKTPVSLKPGAGFWSNLSRRSTPVFFSPL